jgi:hypothetical protein
VSVRQLSVESRAVLIKAFAPNPRLKKAAEELKLEKAVMRPTEIQSWKFLRANLL